MEKIDGVPEIIRFKNILDDATIDWMWCEDNIVFYRHGWIFEVRYWNDINVLTLNMFSEQLASITSVNKPFKATEILPYIEDKFGYD